MQLVVLYLNVPMLVWICNSNARR